MTQLTESDFHKHLLNATPWIDVRSPVEFQAGSILGAINLPLLSDAERQQIGITYKTQGQNAAIALGHHLVSGATRETRLQAWLKAIEQHPTAIIYCFRGGLRSQIVQSWLSERGVHRPIVAGGYKALRRFLMMRLEQCIETTQFLVVSGPTGSGKTQHLKTCGKPHIDLEALAQHRGSAFGALATPQPTQIDFENTLAVQMLKLLPVKEPILIESESRMIGKCALPSALHKKMQMSPRLVLQISLEERVENIFRDYILQSALCTQGDVQHFDELRRSVLAISRKLGGLRTQEILQDLEAAKKTFESEKQLANNRLWIRKLLEWYYDPLYALAHSTSKPGLPVS